MVNGFAGGTCASSSDFDGDGWSGEGEPCGEFSSQESELRRENDHGSSEDMATVRGKVIGGEPWLSAQRARALDAATCFWFIIIVILTMNTLPLVCHVPLTVSAY